MNIFKLNDIFSKEEIEKFNEIINSHKDIDINPDKALGRTLLLYFDLPQDTKEKITKICSDLLGIDLTFTHVGYAEYNNLYGNPNLPPHFDGDNNILVVDYQLESNTSWNLGVDLQSYDLQDNSALIFNANEHIHWRPHKIFKDGEYIKMLFFRFYDAKNKSDYSHKNYMPTDDIFKEVRELRDSIQ
jgi:hypothetical protein